MGINRTILVWVVNSVVPEICAGHQFFTININELDKGIKSNMSMITDKVKLDGSVS